MMDNNTARTFFYHPVNRGKRSHPNILLTMLSINLTQYVPSVTLLIPHTIIFRIPFFWCVVVCLLVVMVVR